MPSQNDLCRKFHPNRDNGKVFKNRVDDFWEKGENSGEGRGNFEKKCKFHKCHPRMNLGKKFHPNQTMGKCSKTEGMVFGEEGILEEGGGEENFEIKSKLHKCHPKMNLCRKSHPNRTMGNCSKIGG